MAIERDMSSAQIAFQVADGEPDQFLVIRYRGTEGFNQLYRFNIELATTIEEVKFDDVVGKAAALSINTAYGPRWFHGIISRLEMIGESHGHTYYWCELVPELWLLTHRTNCRVFQNQTTVEIVTGVIESAGIAADRYDIANLNATYDPREYCVQYRETDYNFICRLMEEVGIRWYFEHTRESHKLFLADTTDSYTEIEGGNKSLPFVPPTGQVNADNGEHIYRLRIGQDLRAGSVVLNDRYFETPELELKAMGDSQRNTELEFYDYPGKYSKQATGTNLARIRAEEFESQRIMGTAAGTSPRLMVGRKFELIEHPSTPTNAEYVITSMTHQGRQSTARTVGGSDGSGAMYGASDHVRTEWLYHGGQVVRNASTAMGATGGNPLDPMGVPNLLNGQAKSSVNDDAPVYDCKFEFIPSGVIYRPPRITPWPVMRGSQTAIVVGPSNEEIYTDEYGRVKVQFPWDRFGKYDENSSCWIRNSQGFAGGQYGMMFLPRVGQEVIVDFLEGDVDRPIITGRVYNADQMPPYKLPDEKTKSVIKTNSSPSAKGTNEIRFEDLKDNEQILIHASKDLHIRTVNDRVENVDKDRHLTVKENKFELVKKAKNVEVTLDLLEKIGGDQSLEVAGKASEKIGGALSVEVGGDVVETYKKNHKNETTMTSAIKAQSIKLEATTGIELKCGGSSISLTPAAIFIMGGPMVQINTAAGPPVPPVTAMATAPTAPEPTVEADTVDPGKDTVYSGGMDLVAAQAPEDIEGYEFETHWIEVELVDEAGQPVVGEVVKVVSPDGELICQRPTGTNGIVHVLVPKEGDYELSFVNLDAQAWERA
ncbi:MAG: type VI secretion system Vgr family protein [Planctomycetota bacterium]|jgi:type VI secretion system secreted protein VgrG